MALKNNLKQYFLGFMSYASHDPSAALVQVTRESEKVICKFIHFEEGMLSRKKKSYHFPSRSIVACLEYFDIELSEINLVVSDFMDNESFINTSYNYRHLVGDFIRNNLAIRPEQIAKSVDHHYAHAMSAWVGSGYEDCAFLAIDGLGSLQSTHSVFVTDDGQLKKIFSQTTPGIGQLYTLITQLIGFESGEEGKTMGLAPYGKELAMNNKYPEIDFQGVYNSLSVDYSKVINRSPDKYLLTDFNINKFEKSDLYNDYRAYLAFSVQQELEKCLIYLAQQIKKVTGKSRLCISGGVALNCVANELIAKNRIFDSLYVFPDSADSGLSVGLAFAGVHKNLTKSEWNLLLATYRHPKFAPHSAIPKYKSKLIDKLPWQNLDLDMVLSELENNSVIGVFWGGYEYGPRALGHRSFIAKATSEKMKEVLNTKIKHREAYRPFAPICLREDFALFFESSHMNHQYMSYAVKSKEIALEKVPAIVHYDQTARVQIAEEDCGLVYKLLIRMKELHGFGLLINTSFNDNNEPIVLDEFDAISCFFRTNCDVLIVNERMLFRNSVKNRISEFSKEIEKEIINRNNQRFQNSLSKILKAKTFSWKKYSGLYEEISIYQKNYSSFIRFHKLILEIKEGKKTKFKRLIISEREIDNFNNLLDILYYDKNCLAESVSVIPDCAQSIYAIKEGDFILSYNLSNLLRDYKNLGIFSLNSIDIFYNSWDFPISNLIDFDQDLSESIIELTNTYENLNSLNPDSAFRNVNKL